MARPAYLTGAVALFVAAGLSTPALAAGPAQPPQPGQPAATAPSIAPRQLTLVTGDVVTITSGATGRLQAQVARGQRTGVGRLFQLRRSGSHLYVLPQSATPYLGTGIDPALFDVSSAGAGQTATSTPVSITYRHGVMHKAIPGVRITSTSGDTATGVVTRATGRSFGAALAAQYDADHSSPTHTTGLFASLSRIAPMHAPAATRPAFNMYTLTVKGIDSAGKPDTGDTVGIYNVDNLAKYAGFPFFVNGIAKVSVPVGHYAAIATFFDFTTLQVRFVTVPQFTVSGNGSVTVDARTATSKVTIATPRPATSQSTLVEVGRTDALGNTGSSAFLGDASTPFLVTPTSTPPSVGQLHYYVYAHETSPSGVAPYTYDVEFPSDGTIPAAEHFVATAGSLATVKARYDSDSGRRPGLETEFSALPWEFFIFRSLFDVTTPLVRTEYYSANPQVAWQHVIFPYVDNATFTLEGETNSAWRKYTPGVTSSSHWFGQPLHPRLEQGNLFPGQTVCPACINGRKVSVLAFPFGDNDPDHFGYPSGTQPGLTENISYGIFADDVPVRAGTDFFDAVATLPAAATTLRLDYHVARVGAHFKLSSDVRTRWTVPIRTATTPLPVGWTCSDRSTSTACTVLPLLQSNYQLPTNQQGALASGAVTAIVNLSHIGNSPALALSTFKVQVSYDGGDHWSTVSSTSLGSGTYRLHFTVPAKGSTDGYGALKLTATDPAHSTLSETITRAFAVA